MQSKIYRRHIMSGYWKNGEPNWRRMEAMARRGWGRFAAGNEQEEHRFRDHIAQQAQRAARLRCRKLVRAFLP